MIRHFPFQFILIGFIISCHSLYQNLHITILSVSFYQKMIHCLPYYFIVYFSVAIHIVPSCPDQIHNLPSCSILKNSHFNIFTSFMSQSCLSTPITFHSVFSSHSTFFSNLSQSDSLPPFMLQRKIFIM